MVWTVSRIVHEYFQYGKECRTEDWTEGFVIFKTKKAALEYAEANCPKDAIKEDWNKPGGPCFISYYNHKAWKDFNTGKEEQGKITYKIQKQK